MSQAGTNQNSGHSGQRTDALIKLALVFFVSLLSFSVGTYVGKKYSDNQHKLALLEPKKEDASPATVKDNEFAMESEALNHMAADLPDSTQPAALTDAEVAQLAEEFANDESETDSANIASGDSNEITSEIPIRTIAESGTTAPVGTIKNNTNRKMESAKPAASIPQPPPAVAKALPAKAVQPAPAAASQAASALDEEREPASLPPKSTAQNLRFTVQIGSYPTESEAEKMTQELLAKGYKSSFIPARVNGQVWYRVNVGVFGTIKEAQDYKREFLEKTRHSSAIVQRIQ